MSDSRHDVAISSGAYVLNGLEPEEARFFERALAASQDLRNEVTELTDTAVELGLALTPVEPGELLRARILAAVAAVPQGPDAAADRVPAAATSVRARARRRWIPRMTALVAGVAAAAALVVTGVHLAAPADPSVTGPIAVDEASDAQLAHVAVEGGGTLTVEWSHRLARAVVSAEGLPRLGSGRTYELWYIDGRSARAAGVFDGSSRMELRGRMVAGDTIGMTIEPRGGAATPSTVPIASLAT